MSYLVLVRHGESRWNLNNKFTGWTDVPLSDIGILEAQMAAEKLSDIKFDIAFTSKLERAQATLLVILSAQESTGIFVHEEEKDNKWHIKSNRLSADDIPVYTAEALNERYYGDLQGMDKGKAQKKYGEKKVFLWRRSYRGTPPGGESLKDTEDRAVAYFTKKIMPEVKKKKNVIVSAHSNTLRTIIKYLEKVSEEDIVFLELPTTEPIIYEYKNKKLKRINFDFNFSRPIYWETPLDDSKN